MEAEELSSIAEAIREVACAATPSYVDVGMFIATVLMAVATIALVYWNSKTVKAALGQITESEKLRRQDEGLALYPLRRDLLKVIDARDFDSLMASSLDFEFLLPGSFELYDRCMSLNSELGECRWKVGCLEDAIRSALDDPENDLVFAKRVMGAVTEEEALSGTVKPFSGIPWYFENPMTGERELLEWGELDGRIDALSSERDVFLAKLRASAKAEIEESIRSDKEARGC